MRIGAAENAAGRVVWPLAEIALPEAEAGQDQSIPTAGISCRQNRMEGATVPR